MAVSYEFPLNYYLNYWHIIFKYVYMEINNSCFGSKSIGARNIYLHLNKKFVMKLLNNFTTHNGKYITDLKWYYIIRRVRNSTIFRHLPKYTGCLQTNPTFLLEIVLVAPSSSIYIVITGRLQGFEHYILSITIILKSIHHNTLWIV